MVQFPFGLYFFSPDRGDLYSAPAYGHACASIYARDTSVAFATDLKLFGVLHTYCAFEAGPISGPSTTYLEMVSIQIHPRGVIQPPQLLPIIEKDSIKVSTIFHVCVNSVPRYTTYLELPVRQFASRDCI